LTLPWDLELKATCVENNVEYMTTPYDHHMVDHVDPLVQAYKIGSGDITWTQHLKYIASKHKPVLLACGAATADEVYRAVKVIQEVNDEVAVMQCNTNYTGKHSNFDYINLNVIRTLRCMYPSLIVGLSDHTPGFATALGAVALGARIIEKHFTDDNSRRGPDHGFAMEPESWKAMVKATRELERALGTGVKRVEDNEKETVVIQRRCLRASVTLRKGEVLTESGISVLRPCPPGALEPWQLDCYLGKKLTRDVLIGEHLSASDFE
jgi:Sialic acid synthase